jgi:DNA-binding MarR family transcriptional regulator
MIEAIVGSEGAERVLLFLIARDEGYASEIATFYDMDVSTVQNQLKRMERQGLLINKQAGRTRVYKFNPRYAFIAEVKALLARALSLAPQDVREALTLVRRTVED